METTSNTTNNRISTASITDSSLSQSESVEKLVEFSKKISEQEMVIKSLESDKASYQQEIEKFKTDIARLQKVIADNFIISTEKPNNETISSVSFNDAYKELIKNNMKE